MKGRLVLTRRDVLVMLGLMYVSAVLSLYRIGNDFAPQSSVVLAPGESAVIELGSPVDIDSVFVFNGMAGGAAAVSVAVGSGDWVKVGESAADRPYRWEVVDVSRAASRIRIEPAGARPAEVNELVIIDAGVNALSPDVDPRLSPLFDERDMFRRADNMSSAFFDEALYAPSALAVIRGEPVTETTHPHLGKFLISLGVRMFGMTPFGWRFMSAVFGALAVGVMYLFARALFGGVLASALTALLFALDLMRFALSRVATIDIFAAFFILLLWFFLREFLARDEAGLDGRAALALGGAAAGLAIATKWTGVFASVGAAFLLVGRLAARVRAGDRRGAAKFAALCVLCFAVVPAVIYALSFAAVANGSGSVVQRAISQSAEMLSYHTGAVSGNPYGSRFWEWPLMLRPMLLAGRRLGDVVWSVNCMGNPAIWWTGALCALWALYGWYRRDPASRLLCVGYLSSWLPWAVISRPTFIYHFFPSSMFMILMIGGVMARAGRVAACAYAAIAALCFVAFYPLAAGIHVPIEWGLALRLLPGWAIVAP